ncbi:hypothetical protein [Actinomadura sp. 7K534]|uniref:hypothetical protein n=1 Tax=Actinomadura sp. 7K534 TaxID=2530366 RepID=UPI00104337EB|nr:hypothetical protein [Actinomadura sp. 7K534]TDB96981.1 hypothetical protein E1266_07960 [Actinomadura sp. 7K534]
MATRRRSGALSEEAPSTGAPNTPSASAPPEGGARTRLAALGALLPALTALPAAVLVVPDAVYNVVPAAASALALGDAEVPALLRATGCALPALLLTVPLAALAARRLPAWAVLATGAAVLLAGLVAARFVPSVPLVAAVRAVQGVGAGIVLPASLVIVWERGSRGLTAAWAGVFAGMLILAMPLALSAVPPPAAGTAVPDWRAALAPVSWPAAAAVIAASGYRLLRGRCSWALPAARQAERGGLLLPLAPTAGFTFLAVVAAHDWSPGARLVVAVAALAALLALAVAGGRDAAAGSPEGCAIVMIAVGLLCLPVAGPMTGLLSATAHVRGDGAAVPALPFALAAAAAVAGALASTRAPARRAVPLGYCLMATGLLLGLAGTPHDRWTPLLPLVPLGAGAGLALAASLRGAGVGAALFGLSLCFPALLAGQLLVLSLEASRLTRQRPVTETQRAGALLDAYQLWLVIAAGAAVLLAAATARARARRAPAHGATLPGKASAEPGGG